MVGDMLRMREWTAILIPIIEPRRQNLTLTARAFFPDFLGRWIVLITSYPSGYVKGFRFDEISRFFVLLSNQSYEFVHAFYQVSTLKIQDDKTRVGSETRSDDHSSIKLKDRMFPYSFIRKQSKHIYLNGVYNRP